MKNNIQILDDELFEYIDSLSLDEQSNWLFLTPHPKFDGRWYVDAINNHFFWDFEDIIGKYRLVSPATLESFLNHAKELSYQVVFQEDPISILSAWDHLNDKTPFSLNSEMEAVVSGTGLLPFQLQGFNYLKREEIKGGIALWSTGVGKTALETALIKQHLEHEDFQLALVVCKRNNKIDTQRKLRQLGDIESYIFDGTPKRRQEIYSLFNEILNSEEKIVGITNYEKFREDQDHFIDLIQDRNVVIFWDEMPTKLSNRKTILYGSVRDVLYDTETSGFKWSQLRPAKLRQYALTATPIENSPVGLLNQVRLIDPDVWPSISKWENKYVRSRNYFSKEPEVFSDLDLMGLEIEFMVHQVDKRDADIAQMFPSVQDIEVTVDWSPEDRRVYDLLQEIAKDLSKEAEDNPEVDEINAFQMIGLLQMLCDAPSMVQKSAENREEFEKILASFDGDEEDEPNGFGSQAAILLLDKLKKPLTNDHCEKLEVLKTHLLEKYPNEKIVVFSRLADYIQPILSEKFEEWGVTYTTYRGTEKQRQEAKDKFREDPDIRVFLSSDAGSDSIDLPEASVVIHYDLPMTWVRKEQRSNRAHRINSKHDQVVFISLMMANSVEDRIAEIIEKKRGYHDGIFKGSLNEEALSARMSAEELNYIVFGN